MKKLLLALLVFTGLNAQEDNNCLYVRNETDPFSNERAVLTHYKVLTHYNPENYNNKKKNFMTFQFSLGVSGEARGLYLKIIVQGTDAYSVYGGIRSGAENKILLENGKSLTLESLSTNVGDSDYDNDLTTYKAMYLLTDEDIALLEESDLKLIRFYWSKGYQDYNISIASKGNLRNTFKCIK